MFDSSSWLSHLAGLGAFPRKIWGLGPSDGGLSDPCRASFFTVFTFWAMPYYSLQMELTPNYDERTRLSAWMALFGKIANLGASWILLLVIGVGTLAIGDPSFFEGKTQWLSDALAGIQPLIAALAHPQPGEKPIVVGARLVAWGMAACILCFGLLPALFVGERYYDTETQKQKKNPFWKSVGESFRCKPLWGLIAIDFFLLLGNNSVIALAQYVNFYYVFGGRYHARLGRKWREGNSWLSSWESP